MSDDNGNILFKDSEVPQEKDLGELILDSLKQAFEKSMVRDDSLAKRLLTIPVVLEEVQVYGPSTPGPQDSSIGKPAA